MERLYKGAQKAHDLDDIDGIYVLIADLFVPTQEEIATVEAEVDDETLTKAIETVKQTVKSSGRHRIDATR